MKIDWLKSTTKNPNWNILQVYQCIWDSKWSNLSYGVSRWRRIVWKSGCRWFQFNRVRLLFIYASNMSGSSISSQSQHCPSRLKGILLVNLIIQLSLSCYLKVINLSRSYHTVICLNWNWKHLTLSIYLSFWLLLITSCNKIDWSKIFLSLFFRSLNCKWPK